MKTFTHAFAGRWFWLLALSVAAGCESNTGLGTAGGSSSPGSAGASPSGAAGAAGTNATGAAGSPPATTGAAGAMGTSGAAGAMADPGTLGSRQGWTGYIENHMFPSGSDAIALAFAIDAKGVVAGSIILGMGTPPPPATDPNVGYPSNLLAGAFTFGPGGGSGYVAEGYSYAFDGGTFDGHRLRFAVNLMQLWAGWCALQTPPSDRSGWCLPNWGSMANPSTNMCAQFDPKTNKAVPVDCGKFLLCSGPSAVCSCGTSTCAVSTGSNGNATFDVFVTDSTASGSASDSFWGTNNVHFIKN